MVINGNYSRNCMLNCFNDWMEISNVNNVIGFNHIFMNFTFYHLEQKCIVQ